MKRSALSRKSPLAGSSSLRRSPTTKRRSNADRVVRELVWKRARGRCEICWSDVELFGSHSIHHRRARGMGGSKAGDTNLPSNLLLLCGSGTTGCHGWVEASRLSSLSRGWLVRQGQSPAAVPVLLFTTGWVLLDDDGSYSPVAA